MEKLNELIEFYEMVGTEPQLLVWLLELRRHRESNWKQRAEAAERESANAKYEWGEAQANYDSSKKENATLRAKLAELAKQRNPDYFLNRIESSDKWGPEVELRIYESQLDASKSQDDHGGGIIELFARPAPATDLSELVPDAKPEHIPGTHVSAFTHWHDGWNSCRAAILRNIEEAK